MSTLGPIIHNPQAVEALEKKKGVKAVTSLDECDGGATVVIRSHGVAERVYGEIKARGLKFADATCPFVEKDTQNREKRFGKGKCDPHCR